MVYWYIGTRSDRNTTGNDRGAARGVILKDGVMAGRVEYDVVMMGEDVKRSEIDKRMGKRIGMIDGMIRMMSGVN